MGLLTTTPYGAAVISMYQVGRSSDARPERRWHRALQATIGSLGLIFSVGAALVFTVPSRLVNR